MEDIIYTLLVIGWIVYGVIKASSKKRKKEHAVDAPISPQKENDDLSSRVNELFGDVFQLPQEKESEILHPYAVENVENTYEIDEEVEEIEVEKKLDSYSGSDNVSSVFVGETEPAAVPPLTDESVGDQSEDRDNDPELESIDLRQAVIHQVILERPY
ncbi:MAG: hypothetical protein GQ527_02195 [Bacteroidales bacterium]|nr:hypothetical protein [Bacteroidales bacterium]